MPVHNSDVADIFKRMADLLEIEGANRFRIRAYRNAAHLLENLPQSIRDMVERDEDLLRLPGIGKDLAGKIREIIETGRLADLEAVASRTPKELEILMKVPGLGPKRVHLLHAQLGISTIDGLQKAVQRGDVGKIPGFGKKLEQTILGELDRIGRDEHRIKLVHAEDVAGPLVTSLKEVKGVKEIAVAGSFRRRKETVGDLDILVTCADSSRVMDHFVAYEDVARVTAHGMTRSSVALRSGVQVDVRVVPEVSYGAALHYFTGSKEHNIAVRVLGVKKGLKINEYGVFSGEGEKRVAGRTEEEVYRQVDLPFVEPELRENRGEIEAARNGTLPTLIEHSDIRGDLHAHTTETDGRNTLEEMVQAAMRRGYEYLAITEHSRRVTMARGLDQQRLARRNDEIDKLNAATHGITVLKSIEVDILPDGSLDLPDEILRELDLVVCAVHYNRNLPRVQQTERIIRALDNPFVHVLAHPGGRLINERPAYDVDMERIVEAAGERGCVLELNAHPDRLDLTDANCKMAKEMGVRIAISTDAHSVNDFAYMRFGVYQGRRGWLESSDVINARSLKGLRDLLRRR